MKEIVINLWLIIELNHFIIIKHVYFPFKYYVNIVDNLTLERKGISEKRQNKPT